MAWLYAACLYVAYLYAGHLCSDSQRQADPRQPPILGTLRPMRQISVPRLFAAAAGVIVFATIVSMLMSLKSATTPSAPSTTSSSSAVATSTVPVSKSTVPVVTIDGSTVTTTTLLGEIVPAPTTTTLPPTPTLPEGVPTEMLMVGGNSAQTIGSEFANRLWPMKVRMITGDPVSQAIKMLAPASTSQVLVYDPSLPADATNYLSYISDVTTAAGKSRILWVEDWRADRGAWRDAVDEVAKSSKNILVVRIHADAAKKGWVDATGALQEAGRVELINRIARAATTPRRP